MKSCADDLVIEEISKIACKGPLVRRKREENKNDTKGSHTAYRETIFDFTRLGMCATPMTIGGIFASGYVTPNDGAQE